MNELLLNEEIHKRVFVELLPETKKFLWIVTADIKDMHVKKGLRYVPFLEVMSDLVQRGVAIRLIHAKEPGPRFREDFDKYSALVDSDLFERILCPRVHTKAIIMDGTTAFFGSPNLTGAGMGAKNPNKRNFEVGMLTDEPEHLNRLIDWVDALYLGDYCGRCQRRDVCPDPIA